MNPRPAETDLTAREVADALWLAGHMHAPPVDTEPAPAAAAPVEPPALLLPSQSETPVQQPSFSSVPQRIAYEVEVSPEPPATPERPSQRSASTLPSSRAIARELRPLKRKVASNRNVEFDEEATAIRCAQEGVWLPEFRPAPANRFDVVMVVDTASLEIWQRTIADFRALLETEGAFRSVRLYFLNGDEEDADRFVLRSGAADGPSHHPAELLDPAGRRVVFVVTDGVGRAWHSGAASRILGYWGRSLHVAVVDLLPQELWHWSGLSPTQVRLRVPASASSNAALRHRQLDAGDEKPAASAVAVPVLELSADWISRWTSLVAGESGWVELTAIFADPMAKQSSTQPDHLREMPALDRLRRFQTIASQPAFTLAGLLAAAPLSISVMAEVSRCVLPSAQTCHLAEVLLGGVMRRPKEDEQHEGFDFVFHDGVREELLATASRTDTARVLRTVSELLGSRIEAARNLSEALDDPTVALPEATSENLPYLKLQLATMRALAGPYSRRAKKLKATITPREKHSEPPPAIIRDVSSTTHAKPTIITADQGAPVSPSAQPQVSSAPQQRLAGDPPPIWSPPQRNINFTGREEVLDVLRSRLSNTTGATAVLPEALFGLGGIGKSQIAVEYAYRNSDDYDVVWWVPSEDPAHIRTAFVELGARLSIPSTGAVNTDVENVREALRRGQPYRRWLLVFDNADSPEAVRPFFPSGGTGHILVTSRNSHWSRFAQTVEIDLFSRDESKQLLQLRNPVLTDDDADRIADVLGDLPLAIEQATSWLSETSMGADEYLELFRQKRTELLQAGHPQDYHMPVATAWNVSLDRLQEETPAALQLLQVCAYFAPEPISRTLFTEQRNVPVPAELSAALADPMLLGDVFRQINRYSLAQIDQRNRTILLHRLVQGALIDRMTAPEQTQMQHAAHVLLAAEAPREPGNTKLWPKYQELLPHVRAARMLECDEPWVRRAALHHAVFLAAWGDDQGSLDFSNELVTHWTEKLGTKHNETLLAAKQVGITLRALGRYTEALAIDESTHSLLRSSKGDNDENTMVMANMVAQDLRALGQFDKAWELSDQAYAVARRKMGDDDGLTLAMADNLGIALRLVGRYVEAREIDQDTWHRRSRILGDDHRFTLATLNNLCLDMRECGEYVEARNLLEKTVIRHRRIIGEEHPDTLRAIKNLAVTRRKAGDHNGGRLLSEEVLAKYTARYGGSHPGALAAAMNLSVDLRQTGDLEAAQELGVKVVADYAATLGDDHPYVLAGQTNLAVALRLLDDPEAAMALNQNAYNKMRAALGDNHPFTLVCATNYASDLAAVGDFTAAYELDTWVLERSRNTLGENHPSTLACQTNLALDLEGLGQSDESQRLHAEVNGRFRQVLGEDHPATIAAARSFRADCDIEPLPTG